MLVFAKGEPHDRRTNAARRFSELYAPVLEEMKSHSSVAETFIDTERYRILTTSGPTPWRPGAFGLAEDEKGRAADERKRRPTSRTRTPYSTASAFCARKAENGPLPGRVPKRARLPGPFGDAYARSRRAARPAPCFARTSERFRNRRAARPALPVAARRCNEVGGGAEGNCPGQGVRIEPSSGFVAPRARDRHRVHHPEGRHPEVP